MKSTISLLAIALMLSMGHAWADDDGEEIEGEGHLKDKQNPGHLTHGKGLGLGHCQFDVSPEITCVSNGDGEDDDD